MWWKLIIGGLIAFIPFIAASQDDEESHRDSPEIVGQDEIVTNEDNPVTIRLSDLEVKTDSWWYPLGFSLRLHKGHNYKVNNDDTVIPDANFHGELTVPVTVRDGNRESKKFPLKVVVLPVNDRPAITSQDALSTPEEQSVTVSLNNLRIDDPDDNQFTLELGDGNNFTKSGNLITPATNFNGDLRVPARVSDGEASSEWYEVRISVTPVNDKPVVVGQKSLETDQNKTFNIPMGHLEVKDPDDNYPSDFSLVILPSENNTYTASGNSVTPALNFAGDLTVRLKVNDGQADSDPFNFRVKVIRVNDRPSITGQREAVIEEDHNYNIVFSDLNVTDRDNPYPDGFSISVLKGENYSFEGSVITPTENFSGRLSVNVVVNDGYENSQIFPFNIEVSPVNDAPAITRFEEEPLEFDDGRTLALTEIIEIADPDDDSLESAEILFHPPRYRPGVDELLTDRSSDLVSVQFDAARGIMTMTGSAPISEYVEQIRSVRYNRVAAFDGPTESRIIFITVHDGEAVSKRAERIINGDDVIVDLDIPTAFTPNGDMTNDTWVIRPLKNSDKFGDAVIRVFSASGYMLFETTGFETAWDGMLDGKVLPAGTYFYTIEFNPAVSRVRYRGVVALLR